MQLLPFPSNGASCDIGHQPSYMKDKDSSIADLELILWLVLGVFSITPHWVVERRWGEGGGSRIGSIRF